MQSYPTYSTAGYLDGFGPGVLAYTGPGGAATPACNLADNVGPYNLADGDDLDITIDGDPPVTATFLADPAEVTGGAEPYNVAGATMRIRVGPASEPTQNVVLAGAAATAADVAAQLNAAFTGVQASDLAGSIHIETDAEGTAARLEFVSGSALPILGIAVGVVNGAGNVANIDAVTVAEIDTIVTAAVAPDATVTNMGGKPEICTVSTGPDATLEVGGTAAAIIGFRAGEIAGLGVTGLIGIRWGKSRGLLVIPPAEPAP